MTLEELEKAIAEAEKQFREQKFKLVVEYCDANNPVKIGDTITDKYGSETILVDKIKYSSGSLQFRPECVYHGQVLTKQGIARKDGKRSSIYQSRL